jgi:hypothetical protein
MKIDIDDEVYAWLEARVKGFESPNDVLRREVLGAPTANAKSPSDGEKGSLWAYITAGLIEPGDELIHIQKRKGNTFRAAVDADGWIVTDRSRYKQPSPALKEKTGSEINGWYQWTHVKSDKTLHQLKTDNEGAISDD